MVECEWMGEQSHTGKMEWGGQMWDEKVEEGAVEEERSLVWMVSVRQMEMWEGQVGTSICGLEDWLSFQ